MTRREVLEESLVQGYCTEGNTHKVLDPDLIKAQVKIALTKLAQIEESKKLTVEEINLVLWKASHKWNNTHNEKAEGYIRFLSQAIYQAQAKKREHK